ncbi:hypothetical protein [Brevibacterium oceani]|uniref:hypothetical protein n=1 Tax=Brevibacterium oceani TaxID=358099 RepID=UPI0015E6CBFA|nr:hypothetical protein [Brevibacterium oceani]
MEYAYVLSLNEDDYAYVFLPKRDSTGHRKLPTLDGNRREIARAIDKKNPHTRYVPYESDIWGSVVEIAKSNVYQVILNYIMPEYGKCLLVMDAGISAEVSCGSECQNALGDVCICACGKANHGMAVDRPWLHVGDRTIEEGETKRNYRWFDNTYSDRQKDLNAVEILEIMEEEGIGNAELEIV